MKTGESYFAALSLSEFWMRSLGREISVEFPFLLFLGTYFLVIFF